MSELRFYKRTKTVNMSLVKEIFLWTFQIVLVLFFAVVLVWFYGQQTNMIGQSMNPVLKNEEHVLIDKLRYTLVSPKRNDIVVFRPNGNKNAHYQIKRVIGLPGETVEIKEGQVYINGEALAEKNMPEIENPGIVLESIELAEDEFFLLGDNRNASEDSRFANIGNVKRDHIEGAVWLRVSPADKIGFMKNK